MRDLIRRHPVPSVRVLVLGLAAGLVAILVQSFADFNLHLIPHSTLFWIDLGLVAGLSAPGTGHRAPVADGHRAVPSRPLSRSRRARHPVRMKGAHPSGRTSWVPWGMTVACLGLIPFQGTSSLADVYARRGHAALRAGGFDEGIRAFQRALTFKPFAAPLHVALSNAYEAQYTRNHRIEALRGAIREYERAIACHPYFAPYYGNLGRLLIAHHDRLAAQDLDRAMVFLKQGASLNPFFWGIHNNLGVVYQLKGAFLEAEREYRRAIELNPDNPEVHNNLGTLYHAMGRFDQAATAFQRLIALKPNQPDAQLRLGKVYQAQGNIDQAVQHFQYALELNRTSVSAWYNLGNCYLTKGALDSAELHYEAALRLDPGNRSIASALRQVQAKRGKHKR